jgi:hypothetical protein
MDRVGGHEPDIVAVIAILIASVAEANEQFHLRLPKTDEATLRPPRCNSKTMRAD